jgi:hypothetical protein
MPLPLPQLLMLLLLLPPPPLYFCLGSSPYVFCTPATVLVLLSCKIVCD